VFVGVGVCVEPQVEQSTPSFTQVIPHNVGYVNPIPGYIIVSGSTQKLRVPKPGTDTVASGSPQGVYVIFTAPDVVFVV
jgi:hypothetical protein